MRLRPSHLRTRLTLWYVLILAALLAFAWAGTGVLLFWQLRSQFDQFSIQEVETVEGLFFFSPDGKLQLREDYHTHPQWREVIDRFIEVLSPGGTLLFRNEKLGDRSLGGPLFGGEGIGGYSVRSARLSDGTPVRIVSRAHSLDGRPLIIRLAHSEEPLFSRLRDLFLASLIVLPIVLVAAWVVGYALACRALRPIEQMARRAQQITPEKLHQRLPDDGTDELGQLARIFNNTLGRLEQAFQQLRRFTSDASHELRTPLAMIRSVGEVGLQKDGTCVDYRDIIGSMLEEVNRLTSLIDNLLLISRADAGSIQLNRRVCSVMSLAREAAGLFDILLEEKSQKLLVEGDEGTSVEVDCLFLRQALVNIIHNAIKYSPVGETISVRVRLGRRHVVIEIQDHGPGIPNEDQSKVFDRFYRVDKARWRESGGAGLGLSIAKWAVEAHGGVIQLRSEPNRGCEFRIMLPISMTTEGSASPTGPSSNRLSCLKGTSTLEVNS